MFTKLESLRLRAIALRSSIHNEQQLTAVELAGMCAKKTNELIDVINEIVDYVQNELPTATAKVVYDEVTETLNIGG